MKAIASTSCGKMTAVALSFVIGLLGFVSLAAANDPRLPKSSPVDPAAEVSALSSAKTLHVDATCYKRDGKHGLVPDSEMHVTFARPEKFRVQAIDLTGDGCHQEEPDLFVTDGSKISEYLAAKNVYRAEDIPDDVPLRLCHLTDVDRKGLTADMPDGFRKMFTPLAGESTTVKSAYFDRRPALLIDRVIPPTPVSSQAAMSRRLWCDRKTGLPIRYEKYRVAKGVETVYRRIDYANWQIDRPVPESAFVWKAPWSARPYSVGDAAEVTRGMTDRADVRAAQPADPPAAAAPDCGRSRPSRPCRHRPGSAPGSTGEQAAEASRFPPSATHRVRCR